MNLSQWLSQLNIHGLIEFVIAVAAALICVTFHEVSHGYMALILGDRTAKDMGRLSLNPLRHLDLMGLLCMALAHFGWARPVPIDPRNFKNFRRGMALTALAGPLANLLLAIVFLTIYFAVGALAAVFAWGSVGHYVSLFFWYVAYLSTVLCVFNLFPIPPLDGSKVLLSFLPSRWYIWVLRYERYGFILLAVLLYVGVLDGPLMFFQSKLMELLTMLCGWPYMILDNLLR